MQVGILKYVKPRLKRTFCLIQIRENFQQKRLTKDQVTERWADETWLKILEMVHNIESHPRFRGILRYACVRWATRIYPNLTVLFPADLRVPYRYKNIRTMSQWEGMSATLCRPELVLQTIWFSKRAKFCTFILIHSSDSEANCLFSPGLVKSDVANNFLS